MESVVWLRVFLALFLELSLISLTHGQGSGVVEFTLLFPVNVEVLSDSSVPTEVIIMMTTSNSETLSPLVVDITLSISTEKSEGGILLCTDSSGNNCNNLVFHFGGDDVKKVVYLTAPSISDPVIKDHEVKLVVTQVGSPPDGVADMERMELQVVIKDNRRLRVGFNESGTVEFTEAGNATLYVTNFDKEYQLENTLDMQIILRRSSDHSNVTTKSATLPFPSTLSKPITFTHLEPNQQYEAIIFITDPHQREYVLEPHIVHVEYNVEKGQLSKLQKDYHELDAKYQELLKQCSPTSTEMIITEVITTDSDLNQTHPSNDDDDDDDDDDESSTKAPNKDDIYMWWVFAGFIVLIVVAVAGYLLYNQRAKVMVYVGSVWKGSRSSSFASTTNTKQSRRSNKYTPLPTSVHDTLTHED